MSLLILQGHPTPGSFNDQLAQAYARGAREAGAQVHEIALGALRFDPVLRSATQALEPDLIALQEQIIGARHIALFLPTWWAGPPALVKGVVDRVMLPGWAYRYRANNPLPEGLLRGRSARLITTMDSPRWWYWLMHRGALHAAMIPATLKFVGIKPVAKTTIYEVRTMREQARMRWLAALTRQGRDDARRLR